MGRGRCGHDRGAAIVATGRPEPGATGRRWLGLRRLPGDIPRSASCRVGREGAIGGAGRHARPESRPARGLECSRSIGDLRSTKPSPAPRQSVASPPGRTACCRAGHPPSQPSRSCTPPSCPRKRTPPYPLRLLRAQRKPPSSTQLALPRWPDAPSSTRQARAALAKAPGPPFVRDPRRPGPRSLGPVEPRQSDRAAPRADRDDRRPSPTSSAGTAGGTAFKSRSWPAAPAAGVPACAPADGGRRPSANPRLDPSLIGAPRRPSLR